MPTPEQYEKRIKLDLHAAADLRAKADHKASIGKYREAKWCLEGAEQREWSAERHQAILDQLRREQGGMVYDESGFPVGQAVPR